MTAKKYVAFLLILALMPVLFIWGNLILWHGYVKATFFQGDLSRLGNFRSNETITPRKRFPSVHAELRNYLRANKKESFDVITFGDSFSNGGGGCFYQDILASEHNLKILNARLGDVYLGYLHNLISSGVLDEMKPRALILESVGRYANYRFTREENYSENFTRAQLEEQIFKPAAPQAPAPTMTGLFPQIMFQANQNFFNDFFYRRKHPENLSAQVFFTILNRPLFTNKNQENLLLHYYGDLDYLSHKIDAATMNKNLNNVAEILAKKNIKLIFMLCVDKYDLYFPYIKNKRGRPENNLFEELRKVPDKKYIFIDTKKILREALEQDEKDLYWLNDTHWSWRGMSIVCEKIFEALK